MPRRPLTHQRGEEFVKVSGEFGTGVTTTSGSKGGIEDGFGGKGLRLAACACTRASLVSGGDMVGWCGN
jgi:hypothetical protein